MASGPIIRLFSKAVNEKCKYTKKVKLILAQFQDNSAQNSVKNFRTSSFFDHLGHLANF